MVLALNLTRYKCHDLGSKASASFLFFLVAKSLDTRVTNSVPAIVEVDVPVPCTWEKIGSSWLQT